VGSSRKLLVASAFALLGISVAAVGAGLIVWLVARYPASEQLIQRVGAWLIGAIVCVASVYPILAIYGLVRPPRWFRR
jgi:hypothetical protein